MMAYITLVDVQMSMILRQKHEKKAATVDAMLQRIVGGAYAPVHPRWGFQEEKVAVCTL
ncbi:unnamed protein product [Lepidochelys olivacea]